MRKIIMIVLSVLILGLLNYSIYEKEQVKKHGKTILLKLVPVDPRSLMQGDYMQLRYDVGSNISNEIYDTVLKDLKRGYLVIRPDTNNVAQFVRIYEEEHLSEDEYLLFFHVEYRSISIVPDTFLFQEGHASYYEDAKYGIFKFDKSGKYILTGLADKDRNSIIPPDIK